MIEGIFGEAADMLPPEIIERLEKNIFLADMSQTAREWASLCIASFVVCLFLSIALLPYFLDFTKAILMSLLVSVVAFAVVMKIPDMKKKLRAGDVERELPIALRTMASQLSINLPFEDCIKNMTKGYGELSKEFKKTLADVSTGSSMQEALEAMSKRVDSRTFRRTAMHLVVSYEKGGSGKQSAEVLKKAADELVHKHNSASKEYGGKLVMYSLVFIAVSVILPAFFQAFVIIGSSFMESTVEPMEALLIPILVFPLIDIAILAFIRLGRPAFL